MKKTIFVLLILLLIINFSKANEYKKCLNEKSTNYFFELRFKNFENIDKNLNDNIVFVKDIKLISKLPSFWFPFIFGLIGTYFIYTAGLGLVAFGIVFFVKKGDKKEAKKAILGCLLGMLMGGMLKFVMLKKSI